MPAPPGQPSRSRAPVSGALRASPTVTEGWSPYPAYRTSCSLQISGPGRCGVSGAKTVMVGRTRPPLVASRRWSKHSAAMASASAVPRRSRTRSEFQ